MKGERAERFHCNLTARKLREKGKERKRKKRKEKEKPRENQGEKGKEKRETKGEGHGSKGEEEREFTVLRRGRGKAPRATTGSREPPSPPPSSVTL